MFYTNCPIWNVQVEERSTSTDARHINSPRAGGQYLISRHAEVNLRRVDNNGRALLTTWIVDQHRAGEECPSVTSNIVEAVRVRPRLKLSARLERFFEFISKRALRVGETIVLWPNDGKIVHDDRDELEAQRIRHELCAWLECSDEDELRPLTRLLVEQGLLANRHNEILLSAKGYERLEAVEQRLTPSIRAFVAMWFSSSMDDAYVSGIEPAIRDTGYEPVRIDRKEHINKIDDEIVAEIRRSRFLVADFTCGLVGEGDRITAIPRGGVYYEAGLAQGLGIPVIWCCREDHIGHVHFDTRQFAHILWKDAGDLRKQLRNRIAAVIGENPSK